MQAKQAYAPYAGGSRPKFLRHVAAYSPPRQLHAGLEHLRMRSFMVTYGGICTAPPKTCMHHPAPLGPGCDWAPPSASHTFAHGTSPSTRSPPPPPPMGQTGGGWPRRSPPLALRALCVSQFSMFPRAFVPGSWAETRQQPHILCYAPQCHPATQPLPPSDADGGADGGGGGGGVSGGGGGRGPVAAHRGVS